MYHRPSQDAPLGLKQFLGVFGYTRRALSLVWSTNRSLTICLGILTLLGGLNPVAVAYVSRLLVDTVVAAMKDPSQRGLALQYVLIEGGLVLFGAACSRGFSVCQYLLRAQLGQRVNEMILEKALTLDLTHFEDSEIYDKMTQARRQASSRPLGLVMRTFDVIQSLISISTAGALLWGFSPWAVLVLVLAGLPAFLAEARFAGQAFRLFKWQSAETRQQSYLEVLIAREDHAKEVMLYGLGPLFLARYRDIFRKLYREDRNLTIKRSFWGFLLQNLSTLTIYGAYVWIVMATVANRLTLGQMTMYLQVFRLGQTSVSNTLFAIGGMYEDNLYLSNLYEFLELPVSGHQGTHTSGPDRSDGVRFENVSFCYPGASEPAVKDVSFHLKPGDRLALVGENGSGKTTLIKLLTRLYRPSQGRITLDGRDLEEWDIQELRRRVGVIFQDFVRYQLLLGENLGAGDVSRFENEDDWREAARLGQADQFVEKLPKGYRTQLGRWFKEGRELSGGQWQKVALARAFMRREADILVLDEPTAAMDAEAEAQVFEHVKRATGEQRMVILISHRFSTVRMADHIVVLRHGHVVEQGSHEELLARAGTYARLFELQASGYR